MPPSADLGPAPCVRHLRKVLFYLETSLPVSPSFLGGCSYSAVSLGFWVEESAVLCVMWLCAQGVPLSRPLQWLLSCAAVPRYLVRHYSRCCCEGVSWMGLAFKSVDIE